MSNCNIDYSNEKIKHKILLIHLNRRLSDEQINKFRNWIKGCISEYQLRISENDMNTILTGSMMDIFDTLIKYDAINHWQNGMILDFLVDENLEKISPFPPQKSILSKVNNNNFQLKFGNENANSTPTTNESQYQRYCLSPSPNYCSNMYSNDPQMNFTRRISENGCYYPHNNCNSNNNNSNNNNNNNSNANNINNNENNKNSNNFQNYTYNNQCNGINISSLTGAGLTFNTQVINGNINLPSQDEQRFSPMSDPQSPEEEASSQSPLTSEFIEQIATEIGKSWKTVARRGLKLREGKINEIDHDQRYLRDKVTSMIYEWKTSTELCSQFELAKALCSADLRGIVNEFFPQQVAFKALKQK